MNLEGDVVTWPKQYKKIPKPYYVVRCDDHFIVCKLDHNMNLLKEASNIHWNRYIVRRWALDASERGKWVK